MVINFLIGLAAVISIAVFVYFLGVLSTLLYESKFILNDFSLLFTRGINMLMILMLLALTCELGYLTFKLLNRL